MTSRISRTLVFVVLCLIAVSTVYPLIFMALNSMRSSSAFELSPSDSVPLEFLELHLAIPASSLRPKHLHSFIVVVQR